MWGGSRFLGFNYGALPLTNPSVFGNNVNRNIAGSTNVGVSGNPGTGGSGLNLFPNPEAVYNSFRRVNISPTVVLVAPIHCEDCLDGIWTLPLPRKQTSPRG